MSLKLTVPKQSNPNSKIYYVTSESNPEDTHIVVRSRRGHFFCDCRDFMIRKLPLNSNGGDFELCKHGEFCKYSESQVPAGHELHRAVRQTVKTRKSPAAVEKFSKYYVALLDADHNKVIGRSLQFAENYPTQSAAQQAINKFCKGAVYMTVKDYRVVGLSE